MALTKNNASKRYKYAVLPSLDPLSPADNNAATVVVPSYPPAPPTDNKDTIHAADIPTQTPAKPGMKMGTNDGDQNLYSWWLHDDDHVGLTGELKGWGASPSTTSSNSWYDYDDHDDASSYDSTRSDRRDLTDAYNTSSEENVAWCIDIIIVICFLVIVGAFAHCVMKHTRERPNPASTTTTSTVAAPAIPPRQHQERRTPQIRHDDSPSFRMKVLKVLFPEQRAGSELITCSPDWPEVRSFRYESHREVAIGDDDAAPVCGICTEKYALGDVLMMGLCKHVYHRDCCLGWVAIKNTCPLCRKEMFDEKTYRDIAERLDEEEQTC